MDTTGRAESTYAADSKSLKQEAFLQCLRTAGVLEHAVAEGLKPYGLTPTQYNALRILRGAGEKGLCRNEVGARMLNPVPDATRLLDRLIAAGHVVKCQNPADRRYVTARITPKGLELLAELDEPVSAMHRQQLGHMSDAELRRMADLLETARTRT